MILTCPKCTGTTFNVYRDYYSTHGSVYGVVTVVCFFCGSAVNQTDPKMYADNP